MKTIYWLGGHKTGTTFLQGCLDLSRDALAREHIQYVELEEFRDKYTRPLLNEHSETAPAPSEFDVSADGQILIFDENIPGYVQHALSKRGFYPEVAARTATVAGHLGLQPDEIVYGVRSYIGFLPSLYIETLKSTPFVTFDSYLERSFRPRGRSGKRAQRNEAEAESKLTDFRRLSWPTLLDRIAKAYPDVPIRVYFHEQLRGREAALLGEVLGIDPAGITLLDKAERVGFSQRAVRAMHELHEQGPVQPSDVRRAVQTYPTSAENPTYAPLDDAERSQLATNYEQDVAEIRANPRFDVIDLAD